jgi:tetratricopeptide (TPR) repeat protein
MPDVKVVIVGGFARNPALYYEVRLDRVTKLLGENPDDLDAYDAAGVACDRLGRSDDAIEWMTKKLAAMDRIAYAETAQPNHRYRYLANLGTFHAHKWFHDGADRTKLGDLERARDLVALAIKENPDAHFGREKYQLRFIEWLLAGPRYFPWDDKTAPADASQGWVPNFLGLGEKNDLPVSVRDNTNLREMGLEDAVQGICGLITQGTAFYALALLHQIDGKSAFSYFAMLRVQELLAQGRRSIVANLPPEAFDEERITWIGYSPTKDQSAATSEYSSLRASSTQWQEQRTSYLLERLRDGQHPDTDGDFWDDFDGDPNQMEVPSGAVYEAGGFVRAVLRSDWFWISMIFAGGTTLMILYYLYARRRDRNRAKLRYST